MKSKLISTGLKQSAFTIFGNIISSGIAAIAMILIARLLGPENYGEFSVGFAVSQILIRLNDWGLSTAILKYAQYDSDAKTRNSVYSLTLKYKLIISSLIILVGLLSYKQINSYFLLKEPKIILAAFCFGLVTVYYEQLLNVLQSIHSFVSAVVINIIQATTKLVGISLFFFLSVKQTLPLFIWYLIAPLAPVLLFRWVLPATVKFDLSIKNPKIKSKIWLLVKHSSIAVVSAGIIEHIDILFLKNNLTSYETGLYGGASRFALLFALVAYSLASVLNPRVALYKNYRHLSPYLKKSWMVVLLSLVGFLLFIPFARPLIELTIGSEYLPGLKILLMLAGASFIGIASVPFVALFYSFNADWYFSVSGMLQLVIVLVGNAFFVPVFGLEAAAWTRLIARLFLFLFSMLLGQYFYLKKYRAKSS